MGRENEERLQVDTITFISQVETHTLRESKQFGQAEQAELGLDI